MRTYILIVVAGVILVLGGLLVLITQSLDREASPETLGIQAAEEIIPVGYKKYVHAKYGFSILYPDVLVQKEIDEGGNASTITFQNSAEGKGFQIFIVPYQGEQVSEERFRRDIPSGVRRNTEEVLVDGAPGTAFYSQDIVLGETREVWFVRGGYLYEVTTLKTLEADLLEILESWQFIEE